MRCARLPWPGIGNESRELQRAVLPRVECRGGGDRVEGPSQRHSRRELIDPPGRASARPGTFSYCRGSNHKCDETQARTSLKWSELTGTPTVGHGRHTITTVRDPLV